ncbi:MAG: serine/threonine protein kinase [Deltaproteobacteria bacterium]|nr:serine/threonine protein kinase [Deltaproteobacteria bacterium]
MARTDDDNDPLIGRVIDGRFTVQSVLGRGGMGVVYRAHQASLERSVALKVMAAAPHDEESGSREAEFQRRFFLEAATVARLKHPNTITVFDYGSSVVDDQRIFFIAMELLDGTPLSKLVSQGRALEPIRAVHIALQICRALREAHRAGIVHRDLKPGNVMILRPEQGDDDDEGDGDFVKVLDFGLAKTRTFDGAKPIAGLTKSGSFMGSPRYSAPEQVEGRPVDARADIYSMGCLLYRLVSGKTPFDGQTPVEIMLKHLHDGVPPLDVDGLPETLERLVMECLEKDPAERPQSMDVVIQRLKLARAELGGPSSGVVVLSDERTSLPPQLPVSSLVDGGPLVDPSFSADELPPPEPELLETALARPVARPVTAWPTPAREQTAPSTVSPGALRLEDHTPSSRGGSRLSVIARPPRRPWAAIAAGIVLGLAICVGLIAWRLGSLDPLIVRLWAGETGASTPHEPPPQHGPFAELARVRIKTTPPGADVLEVQGGLPRLLGVTPLTLTWDVAKEPRRRELVLRQSGYRAARATLDPPAPRGLPSEPVWLDVEATLRRE